MKSFTTNLKYAYIFGIIANISTVFPCLLVSATIKIRIALKNVQNNLNNILAFYLNFSTKSRVI
jgi:hypothetical protein